MPRALCFLALLLALGPGVPGRAAEPQVAFALKAGWVEFRVRQDGKPLAGAVIQILDERGATFAEGETGPGGETAFPMPAGSSCTVEIKTGTRTADPIRLVKTQAGVEPARVLLSYGLRPCCRSLVVRPQPSSAGESIQPPMEAKDSPYLWASLAAMFCALGVAAVQVMWFKRRRPNTPDVAAKEER